MVGDVVCLSVAGAASRVENSVARERKLGGDSGGLAEKKRETAGILYKNNGDYRRFLEFWQQ